MTFNDDITYEKAKRIADEVVININKKGLYVELVFIDRNKIYRF